MNTIITMNDNVKIITVDAINVEGCAEAFAGLGYGVTRRIPGGEK